MALFPNGVQAIAGTAAGARSAAAGGVYSRRRATGRATVSTGANGYFYLALPAGTLGASGDRIGATPGATCRAGARADGLVYTDAGALVANC